MTLLELIAELERVLAEHSDLADRHVLNREGDYTGVQVHEVSPEQSFLVKGLMVG